MQCSSTCQDISQTYRMTQNRVNQERTDHLDLLDVANAFISGFKHMLYTFGAFKVLDRARGLYITSTCLITYHSSQHGPEQLRDVIPISLAFT